MQEINYSDANLDKESEDMRTTLDWMNIEWYTLVVCVGNLTFVFCSCILCIPLSFFLSVFILSLNVFIIFFTAFTSFSMCLCNSKTFCVNSLDLSPLTGSYFSNKLLTRLLLFEITYSSFLFQNMILGMTNSKSRPFFRDVAFGGYVVLHFVN